MASACERDASRALQQLPKVGPSRAPFNEGALDSLAGSVWKTLRQVYERTSGADCALLNTNQLSFQGDGRGPCDAATLSLRAQTTRRQPVRMPVMTSSIALKALQGAAPVDSPTCP